MLKYIYLKGNYTSKQKLLEVIAVIFVFLLSSNINPYIISVLLFVTSDVDFIKILQENNFAKSYYFNPQENMLLLLSNFIMYLLIIMLSTIFIQMDSKILINLFYSITAALIIQGLIQVQTNKYNLVYCFIVLQTLALTLLTGVRHVI